MKNNEIDLEHILSISNEMTKEEFEELLKKLSETFNNMECKQYEEFFLDPSTDYREKIAFLLKAISFDTDETDKAIFYYETNPYLLEECIKENEDEFVDIVTQSTEMQELLIKYIVRYPLSAILIWHKVYGLPLIKERILDDEKFVEKNFALLEEFFENLPEEYGYLVCLYDVRPNEFDIKYTQQLYKKYFGDKLEEYDINALILMQYKLKEENRMNLSLSDVMGPLECGLKRVLQDEGFSDILYDLKNKIQTNMYGIMQLAFYYSNSKLFDQLITTDEIDKELREKLEYISRNRKIIGIDSLEDLKQTSLEELLVMDKEPVYTKQLDSVGGPNSMTFNTTLFPNGSQREIRRIDQDGTLDLEIVDRFENHIDAVIRIYEDDIEFPKECDTVWKCSLEGTKQLSSITLVIESEQCHIYLPDSLTREQKAKCLEIINSAKDNGKYGIVVYDFEKEQICLFSEDLVDKEVAKKYIEKLKVRRSNIEIQGNNTADTFESRDITDRFDEER